MPLPPVHLSIRTKLLATMIGLTFVSTGIFIFVAYRATYSEINRHLNQYVQSTYQNVRTFLSLTAKQVDELSMSILSNDDVQTALRNINRSQCSFEEIEQYRKQVENEFLKMTLGRDEIRGIFLISKKGFPYSLILDPRIDFKRISKQDLEQVKTASGTPVWLQTDPESQTIPMGRMFTDTASQEPSGILIIFFKEQYFSDLFRSIHSEYKGNLFLLSHNGFVISHADKNLLGTPLQAPYVDSILQETSDISFYSEIKGTENRIWAFFMPDYNCLNVK